MLACNECLSIPWSLLCCYQCQTTCFNILSLFNPRLWREMWHFRPIISWNLSVNHKHRQPFWSFYRVITDKFTLFPSDQCTRPRLLVTCGCCITSPFLSFSTPSHVTILSLPLLTWLLYPVAHPFSRHCILSPPSLLTWLLYPPSHVTVVSCRPPLLTSLNPVTSSLHPFSRELYPVTSPHPFSRDWCIL